MAEMSVAYLEDGEYLNIATNADRHGSMIGIVPTVSHEVVATPTDDLAEVTPGVYDLSVGKPWARTVSPVGDFKIIAPYDDRLEDWQLELRGLPRIYDRLEFGAVENLFGGQVAEQVRAYHRQYGPRRESVGDLLAKLIRRGPFTHEEASDALKQSRLAVESDLNRQTREARMRLLETAQEDSGRLLVARSVLIRP